MKKPILNGVYLESYMSNEQAEQTFAFVKAMPDDECYFQGDEYGRYKIGHEFPATLHYMNQIKHFNFAEWIDFHGIKIV